IALKGTTLPAPMRLELKPLRSSEFRISRSLGYIDPSDPLTRFFAKVDGLVYAGKVSNQNPENNND
ncbi:MAG: hypothetical protein MJK04_36570, partial [Psychrosphaera sp.]|nr:hypothetical protein [Psychrosphaera sp.]